MGDGKDAAQRNFADWEPVLLRIVTSRHAIRTTKEAIKRSTAGLKQKTTRFFVVVVVFFPPFLYLLGPATPLSLSFNPSNQPSSSTLRNYGEKKAVPASFVSRTIRSWPQNQIFRPNLCYQETRTLPLAEARVGYNTQISFPFFFRSSVTFPDRTAPAKGARAELADRCNFVN